MLAAGKEAIITFPEGLIGCPTWQRFSLLEGSDAPRISVLQSLDEAHVRFIVADPFGVYPDFECEISDEDCRLLRISDVGDVRLFCTITIRNGDPAHATANLLGPLAVNLRAGLGKQLVLQDSGYSSRHPIGSAVAEDVSAQCRVG